MVIRFDNGKTLNPHLTDDGILLCDAVFARDGVLEYRTRTGETRRELRPPEENQKAIAEFGLASLTLEHPAGLVDQGNGDRLRKGITLQNPKYVAVIGKGGFVTGQIAVMNKSAQDAVKRGDAAELSAGYKCRLEEVPGVWMNPATGQRERYDAVQRDIRVNHIALTKLGRAGPSVKVLGRFDSADLETDDLAYQVATDTDMEPPNSVFDSQTKEPMTNSPVYPPMATLELPGGSVPVPQEIFNAVQPLLARNDSQVTDLREQLAESEDRADSAEASLKDLQSQVDYRDGMIEGLRDRLDQAETLLEEGGISWHRDSYRADGDGKKNKAKKSKRPAFLEDLDDDDDDEMSMDGGGLTNDMDGDHEGDDDYPSKAKKQAKKDMKPKRGMKKDSVQSQVAELFKAAREAEQIVDLSDLRMDSVESAADIRRYVVEQKMPHVNLEDRADGFVDGLYAAIVDNGETDSYQTDSRNDTRYDNELSLALGQAQANRGGFDQAAVADRDRRMGNHKSPLTANKDTYGKRR
ncbi:MAG: DUF2213 domain-containing protein [Cyanobacteria bacterium P01_F01_bin.3]